MRMGGTLALGALALAISGTAFAAEDLYEPAGSAAKATRDRAWQALFDDPANESLELVSAKASRVARETDSLALSIGGHRLTAYRLQSYTTSTGSTVWSGIIEETSTKLASFAPRYTGEAEVADDPLSSVMLVKNGNKITGNVRIGNDWYKIRPLNDGLHVVAKVNPRSMPADHPPSHDSIAVTPMATSAVEAATTIRVMVNYTPSAAAASGDINGLIDLAVAETNQGYANAGVPITLELANKSQTSYSETGNFDTDLARYRTVGDGHMDEIHTTRNSTAADVGVLIVTNNAYCGLASGIGSTATTAFAEVYWDCATGYYSFGHEIGHLQSARHDPKNDPSTTPYAYGHGYQYETKGRNATKWRTIMAYDCSRGCPRLNYWSNPNVLYGGVPMGTADKSHNARVLGNTAATIAGFR